MASRQDVGEVMSNKKAWSKFALELIKFECPNLLNKVDTKDFGDLMDKVISKYGHAESVLWNTKTPVGTEDRTWVRTWLYTQGYNYSIECLDGDHMKRILERFKAVA